MVREYIYSPHYDFFIEKTERTQGYSMNTFHIHHKYEIYFEIKGTRQYFIDDSAYIVKPGDIILIGPDQAHKTESLEDAPHARYVINFSDDYLKEIASVFPDIDFTSFMNDPENHLITGISATDLVIIEHTLGSLLSMFSSEDPERKVRCKLLLPNLLLHLKQILEAQENKQAHPAPTNNPLIAQAQNYINEHYAEDLSLQLISDELYVSPYHLSRIFKKYVGIGIIDYIKAARIRAAQNLLLNSDENVTMISEMTGFSSSAHFRRVFKEITGLSPQKYRQLTKENRSDSVALGEN